MTAKSWIILIAMCALAIFAIVKFAPSPQERSEAPSMKVEAATTTASATESVEAVKNRLDREARDDEAAKAAAVRKAAFDNQMLKLQKERELMETEAQNAFRALAEKDNDAFQKRAAAALKAKEDAMKPPVAVGYVPRDEQPKSQVIERIVYQNREVPVATPTVPTAVTAPPGYVVLDGKLVRKDSLLNPVHCTEERCGTPVATQVTESCDCEERTTVCSDHSTRNFFSGNTLQVGIVEAPYQKLKRMVYPERRPPSWISCPQQVTRLHPKPWCPPNMGGYPNPNGGRGNNGHKGHSRKR